MSTVTGHTSAIRAKKVLGTAVYDTQGNRIGSIEDVVLDKLSNNILFAVVSFGGFLGISEKYHPIPWSSLKYDKPRGNYIVEFTKEQLEAAPVGDLEDLTRNDGQDFRARVHDYYKAPRYWETPRH